MDVSHSILRRHVTRRRNEGSVGDLSLIPAGARVLYIRISVRLSARPSPSLGGKLKELRTSESWLVFHTAGKSCLFSEKFLTIIYEGSTVGMKT